VIPTVVAALLAASPGAGTSPSAATEPGFGEALGTGAGIVLLVVIAGAFLWFRARAMRRR